MTHAVNRRTFIGGATAAAATLPTAVSYSHIQAANQKLVVGVMGVNGRGSSLARGFAARDNSEVAYVCDVDTRAIAKGIGALEGVQQRVPTGVEDFRRILDDDAVDILVVAAPNHWHAPATVLGCQAGKHVYVEKPCSHTPREGELAVAAARQHDRVVTMGSQRRSRQPIIDAIAKVHGGAIGEVRYARTWYNNRRGPIGTGAAVGIPSWLNYELWQGPCVDRPYKDNLVHYNWHWHWHWGNGELGNNGVHALDVARWGLQVDYPTKVVSAGGRYRFEDDQETADTHMVAYEFGDKMISWEGLSWSPYGPGGSRFGISFHGESGSLLVFDSGYTIFDAQNKMVEEHQDSAGDAEHFEDFMSCIREGGRPTADIEEGHKSTLLCHLGNIAQRTNSTLHTSAENGRILHPTEPQTSLWSKQYRQGWEPTL